MGELRILIVWLRNENVQLIIKIQKKGKCTFVDNINLINPCLASFSHMVWWISWNNLPFNWSNNQLRQAHCTLLPSNCTFLVFLRFLYDTLFSGWSVGTLSLLGLVCLILEWFSLSDFQWWKYYFSWNLIALLNFLVLWSLFSKNMDLVWSL